MALAKRFRPYEAQARTQGALRYGSQAAGLQSLFDDTTQNYQRQSTAQDAAARSLLGTLQGAGSNVTGFYTDAGLTKDKLAAMAGTPTGARLAAEIAGFQADVQNQQAGAQAGRQYIQQRLGDDYRSDVGKIQSQNQAMQTERGLYESSLLEQLIGDDRAARSKINADARQQKYEADQAIQAQNAAQTNALIGQGLLPDDKGNLNALPGGKADPTAPANKPKAPKKPKVSLKDQSQGASDFSIALGEASRQLGNQTPTKELRRAIGQALLRGEDEIKGQPLYDTRAKIKVNGREIDNPNYGKPTIDTRKTIVVEGRKVANPGYGTAMTTEGVAGTPQINNQAVVQAALDMAFDGHLSPATVKKLHALGYSVRGLGNVKTRADIPKPKPGPYDNRVRG